MAALNDLQVAPLLLALYMQSDPTLALMQAVAWFDPIRLNVATGDLTHDDEQAEDEMSLALRVCRVCFPDAYTGAMLLQLNGESETVRVAYLCNAISAHLVMPISDLEELQYGPPLTCYGVDDEELARIDDEDHPIFRSRPVFAWFGVQAGTALYDDWQVACYIGRVLIESLGLCQAPDYATLLTLFEWMFATSGNPLIDWSQDALNDSGSELPEWTPDDIAFVNDLSLEAEAMMQDVIYALNLLERDEAFGAVVRRNILIARREYRQLEKKRGKDHVAIISGNEQCQHLARFLAWPERDGDSAQRSPDAAAGVLPVRDHPAQAD